MIWYDKGTKFTWQSAMGAGQQLDPMSIQNGNMSLADIDMSGAVPDVQPIDRVAAAQAQNVEMLQKRAQLAQEKAAQLAQNVWRDANYANQVGRHKEEAHWRSIQNPGPMSHQIHQAFADRHHQAHQQMGVHQANLDAQFGHLDSISEHASQIDSSGVQGAPWLQNNGPQRMPQHFVPKGDFVNQREAQFAEWQDQFVHMERRQMGQDVFADQSQSSANGDLEDSIWKSRNNQNGFDFDQYGKLPMEKRPDFVVDGQGNVFDVLKKQDHEYQKQQEHHRNFDQQDSGFGEGFLKEQFNYKYGQMYNQARQNFTKPFGHDDIERLWGQNLGPVQNSNLQPSSAQNIGPRMNPIDAYDAQANAAQAANDMEQAHDRLREASIAFEKAKDDLVRGVDPGAQARLEKAQNEKFVILQQLGHKQQEVQYLQHELGDLKHQNTTIVAQLQAVRNELNQAKQDIDWYYNEHQQHTANTQNVHRQLDQRERTISQLQAEVKAMQELAQMEPQQRDRKLIMEENLRRRSEQAVKTLTQQMQSLQLELHNVQIAKSIQEKEQAKNQQISSEKLQQMDVELTQAYADLNLMNTKQTNLLDIQRDLEYQNLQHQENAQILKEKQQQLEKRNQQDKELAETTIKQIHNDHQREVDEFRMKEYQIKEKMEKVKLEFSQVSLELDVQKKKASASQKLLDDMTTQMQTQADQFSVQLQEYKAKLDALQVNESETKRTIIQLQEAIATDKQVYQQQENEWND